MTYGTYTIYRTIDPKVRIDGRDQGLLFGNFAILLTGIFSDIFANFCENDPVL